MEQWKCRNCTELLDSNISLNPTVESIRVSAILFADDNVQAVSLEENVIPAVPHADYVVPDAPPADDNTFPDIPPADNDYVVQDVSCQIPEVVQKSSLSDPTPHIATVKQRGDHYTAGSHPHLHEAEPG